MDPIIGTSLGALLGATAGYIWRGGSSCPEVDKLPSHSPKTVSPAEDTVALFGAADTPLPQALIDKLVGDPLQHSGRVKCINKPGDGKCPRTFPHARDVAWTETVHGDKERWSFDPFDIGGRVPTTATSTKKRASCCTNAAADAGQHGALPLPYPAARNNLMRTYKADDPTKFMQWFPESLRRSVNPGDQTCQQVCSGDETCHAGYTTDDNTCVLYKGSAYSVDERLKKSAATVNARNDHVFIKDWDYARNQGFIRPLVGDDWKAVRNEWIDQSCTHAAQFVTGNPNHRAISGAERDMFLSTCKQSIKYGSDTIEPYADDPRQYRRNRDIGHATAVSGAVNQLRANARQQLDMTVVGDDSGTVVPEWTDVVQVYARWSPQWNTNWYGDDSTSEHLGSETCGFDNGTPNAAKCERISSTNASAYSPELSIQKICRRINGLSHDADNNLRAIAPGESSWVNTLLKPDTRSFSPAERLITDVTNTQASTSCTGHFANTFLCQYSTSDKEITDAEVSRRYGSSLVCEELLRESAYQQAPAAAGAVTTLPLDAVQYSVNGSSDTITLGTWSLPDGGTVWNGPTPPVDNPAHRIAAWNKLEKMKFARDVMHTCALLTNRVVDRKGYNMYDEMIDVALAACYRKEGVRHFNEVAQHVDWPEFAAERRAQLIAAQQAKDAKELAALIQVGIMAGFAFVPGIGELVGMEELGPLEEAFQGAVGKQYAARVADKVEDTDALSDETTPAAFRQDMAKDFLEDATYDIATALM